MQYEQSDKTTASEPIENRVQTLQSSPGNSLTLQFDLSDFGADHGVRIETYPDPEQQWRKRLLVDIKEHCVADGKPAVHTFAHNVRLPDNVDDRSVSATFNSRTKHLVVNIPTIDGSN